MGCAPSKLDSEDTVHRCKERRRLMKVAVRARHHLAAAHSDYCRSLRLTGSALVAFASGESLSVSDHTPSVLLRTSPATTFIPPPSPSSQHHHQKPPPCRKNSIKLPHILSDSSFSSSPPPNHDFTYNARANSNYSTTPSQTSSVWDWDNFYPPPSPPHSEYFQKLHKTRKNETLIENHNSDDDDHDHPFSDDDNDDRASINTTLYSNNRYQTHHHHNLSKRFDDRASNYSSYSHYSNNNNNYSKNSEKSGRNSKSKEDEDDDETEREEVQCSEWGDHDNYSSTSDEDENGNSKSRPDFETFESARKEAAPNLGNAKAGTSFSTKSEKLSSEEDDGKSSVGRGKSNFERMNSDMRIVVRHKDLVEISEALREYFDKACLAGEQVSEMLEAGRAQLDRSLKQLRKTIYHSSGILSNLSTSWTSKPPLAVKYRFEPNSIEQSGGPKSLCSTLERLLAWEKKLYQEVKAREGVKIEHERKLSVLQSQEYRGEDEAKLDRTKASIKRLQSLISVTSQAVSTTSFAIVGLRDSDLVPQLVELCHGFMYMWRSMNQSHQIQHNIVQQVRGLVHHTTKSKSTSDLHRQATRDLDSVVSTWHSSFCRLIKFQRDFVRSLHSWFKLTLTSINNNEPTNNDKGKLSEVLAFFDEWKLAFERIPDMVASEAIKSFNNVVRSIYSKQMEEMKIKKRAETASRELEKRTSSLEKIEKKYYHSYSMVGVGVPDSVPGDGPVLDTQDPLADKKAELVTWQRRVEDEIVKHSKAVEVTRAMTLNNLQTGLPGVFQAMTSFSAMKTEALETVCTRSYAI